MLRYLAIFFYTGSLFFATASYAAEGKIIGEVSFEIPSWFKDSFLEISEDVAEANNSNKHVMLFMHIDRCPYCTRMLKENFLEGSTKSFIQSRFDVIPINIRGDKQIQWDDKTQYSEKSLSRELKVKYTPTIVFLNTKGQRVYQLNGYRKPSAFKHVLNYINTQQYTKLKFSDYIKQQNDPVYTLRPHPLFRDINDFSNQKNLLAVIFEDKTCADCDEFHTKVLNHRSVLKGSRKFTMTRLDAYSNKPIIDINGNKTTPSQWAKKLKINYRPGVVFFDDGEEVERIDGKLYHFHFKEYLRYVSGGFYLEYPSYLQYLAPRQKELLKSGVNIDFGL